MSRVRANTVTNFAGTGTPSLPYGIQVGTGATFSGGTNTISLSTNGSERLSVNSSGVKEVKNGNLNIYRTYIDFSGDQSSTPLTAVALYRPADGTFAISTQNIERLRITASGNVGIGTDNPYEASGYKSLTLDDTTGGQLRFRSSGSDKGLIFNNGTEFQLYSFAGTPMVFKSAANESFRLDTSQRILKGWNGTAFDGPSNSTDIAVAGTSSNNGIQVGRYNGSYGAYALSIFRSRGATVGTNLPTQSNDDVGHITWWGDDGTNWRDIAEITGACDGNTDSGSSPGKIIFKTTKSSAVDSTQAMTIKANHNIEVHDGNIVFETAGNGIDFSATTDTAGMTSEILNDYEVGTWTPTLGGSMTLNSGTWAATGYYTKIGNIVNLEMKQSSGNVSWGLGGLIIAGVPFTPAGSGGGLGGAAGSLTNTSPNISMTVLQWSSGYIYASEAGASQTSMRINITFRVS